MNPKQDTEFRLKLAAGFLREAEEDVRLSRWSSCVDNAQMAVENAAKAVIAMRGPVPKFISSTEHCLNCQGALD